MRNYIRFLAFVALAATLVECGTVANQDLPASIDTSTPNPDDTITDSSTIVSTALIVDQKSGATDDTPPGQPPANTTVTAVDGTLTNSGLSSTTRRSILSHRRANGPSKRFESSYELVFDGTGTGPNDRDASIQGTAYLTYTVVDNSTYSIDPCLQFCDSTEGCVFANLYYEFNNPLLDFVFSQKSNLKCVLYGDIHTAAEKTNAGGQQLEAPPAGLTYIQQSSGYAAKSLADPATPEGYELVFGPTGGANNAPGYMGFAFIDRYDVQACADLCNSRDPDSQGGGCQYFNIWRALVNGLPTTYTCSMYYLPSDQSTAVNTGQGDLVVTYSRGYRRLSVVPDGGFEGFTCPGGGSFCFAESYANWIGSTPPNDDATIFHFAGDSHFGSSCGVLGSATGVDSSSGTLTPAHLLQTTPGRNYTIQLFLQTLAFNGGVQLNPFLKIQWNGQVVRFINPGFSFYTFYEVEVVAQGNDTLAFLGGDFPAYSFIDDVFVFLT